MRKRALILVIMFCLISAPYMNAQTVSNVSKVGITAAPFLTIGVGAKALGMGNAYVATANEASAMFWNPAGIARISSPEGIFSHINWIADMGFDFIGFVMPMGRLGVVGASITSLNMEDMMVRTEERPQGTGEYFTSSDLALAVSYAVFLTDRFSIGFTGKYIRQQIWKESAQGFAIDLGTLFTTGFHGMRIGATLSNFGTDMRMTGEDLVYYHDIDAQSLGNNDEIFAELKTDSWPLPLTFQVGLAMEVIKNDANRLTLAIDAIQPTDNTESVNFGMEYALKKSVFLRGGYRNLFLKDSEEGITFGVGLNLKQMLQLPIRFDYGYADFGRLKDIHCFTLGIEL